MRAPLLVLLRTFTDEELDTLAARKSSIEQAEGQLMRSDKDTSEHFEARIAEQQLHQRQEADLKGYIVGKLVPSLRRSDGSLLGHIQIGGVGGE